MVSNFRKGPAGPCVRSKKHPPQEVLDVLQMEASAVPQVPDSTYCAAHLESVCREAIHLLELVRQQAASSKQQASKPWWCLCPLAFAWVLCVVTQSRSS
jgi:hypothetical protein